MTMQLAGQAAGERWLRWPGKGFCSSEGGAAGANEIKPAPDIKLALERLQKGFMYVGLMEEYDLSVCLFHAMYGGECLQVEFQNMRPGHYHTTPRQDEVKAALQGYSDHIDGRLYRKASSIFWENVKKYNVGRSMCRKLCSQAEHIFGSEMDRISLGNESHYEYEWPGRYYLDDDDL